MIRIDFDKELTALEVRDPITEACEVVARDHYLHANFDQPQQAAFDGSSFTPRSKRKRIGNGNHKNWIVRFQFEPTNISKPHVLGDIVLKSFYNPRQGQFGGWDYGKYGEVKPTYHFVTIHTPSELGLDPYYRHDPEPHIMQSLAIIMPELFENNQRNLFNPNELADLNGSGLDYEQYKAANLVH